MRECHQWRHPECEEPANVERMSDQPVWSGRSKLQGGIRPAQQVQPDLTHAKQVKVIDQKR